jgi:hypothetical protein
MSEKSRDQKSFFPMVMQSIVPKFFLLKRVPSRWTILNFWITYHMAIGKHIGLTTLDFILFDPSIPRPIKKMVAISAPLTCHRSRVATNAAS